MKRWLGFPDIQVPYEDPKTVRLISKFGALVGATGILFVGDEIDAPAPSRWVRSKAGEFANTLQRDIDKTREVLDQIITTVEPYEGEVHLSRSNHGDRVRNYINEKAPALAPLKALDWQQLMDFESLGISYHAEPFEFAKGWVLAHGDEGNMSRTPGQTGLNLAKKWGKSALVGHTHRAGLMHDNDSLNGKVTRHLFGLEIGHAMDLRKAGYLAALAANWQQACAILEEDDKGLITPYLIPIINHKIVWAGEVVSV